MLWLPGLGRPLLKAAAAIFVLIAKRSIALGRPQRCIGPPAPGLSLVPHETCFRPDETVLKQIGRTNTELELKSTEAIMLVPILNLVYREFLRSVLSGMATQGARR